MRPRPQKPGESDQEYRAMVDDLNDKWLSGNMGGNDSPKVDKKPSVKRGRTPKPPSPPRAPIIIDSLPGRPPKKGGGRSVKRTPKPPRSPRPPFRDKEYFPREMPPRNDRRWGESRPGESYIQIEGPGNPSWESRNPRERPIETSPIIRPPDREDPWRHIRPQPSRPGYSLKPHDPSNALINDPRFSQPWEYDKTRDPNRPLSDPWGRPEAPSRPPVVIRPPRREPPRDRTPVRLPVREEIPDWRATLDRKYDKYRNMPTNAERPTSRPRPTWGPVERPQKPERTPGYGGRIGAPPGSMFTMDHIDSDGDGIDDRHQPGPGMPDPRRPTREPKLIVTGPDNPPARRPRPTVTITPSRSNTPSRPQEKITITSSRPQEKADDWLQDYYTSAGLGRVDPEGRAYWEKDLRRGQTKDQIKDNIMRHKR